jgi:hypothetical protein
MLFDPPASLSAWALAQCGLDSRHWLVVRSRPVGQGRQAGLSGPGRHTGTVGPWAPAGAGGSNAPAGNAGSDALAGNAGFGTTAGNAGFGTTAGNAGFGTTAGNAGSGTPPGRAVPLSPAWQPDTAPGVPRGASRLAPLLPGADLLWALEQALKSGQVGAVLAWLPVNLRADALRRLQLAAQAQAGPVFLFRDALARGRPSPAPLRLLLQPAGIDGLALRILKRRGPLLAQPMRLQLPPVLPPAVQARLQAEAEAARVGQGLAAGHAGLLAPQA